MQAAIGKVIARRGQLARCGVLGFETAARPAVELQETYRIFGRSLCCQQSSAHSTCGFIVGYREDAPNTQTATT